MLNRKTIIMINLEKLLPTHTISLVYFFIRHPDSIENLTATSPSTVAPVSTSLLSFDGTIATTFHNTRPSSAGKERKLNGRSHSCGDESDKTITSQCGQETRNQQSQLMTKGVSKQGSTSSPSSQVVKSVFVQGTGWASQVSSIMIIEIIISCFTFKAICQGDK